jgi:hypothetical protein
MEIYAIIKDGAVINTIEYAEQPSNPPPSFEEGVIAVLANGAGVGYTYTNNIFTAPQPFPSWTLVDNKWVAPQAKPEDGMYIWNESTLSWVKLA